MSWYLSIAVGLSLICSGEVLAAAPVKVGTFLQEVAHAFTVEDGLPSDDVTKVIFDPELGLHIVADGSGYRLEGDTWTRVDRVPGRLEPFRVGEGAEVRALATGPGGTVAVATAGGVFTGWEGAAPEEFVRLVVRDGKGRLWAEEDVRGVAYDARGRLWIATPAGAICGDGEQWSFFEGRDGLPYADFTAVAAGGDGSVWFGTTRGIVIHRDGEWHYRQGRRWLPDDRVRAVAVDSEGSAWIATPAGLGWIERRPMSLAEKADFYETELERIKRTPYGYTSEVRLTVPGDKSTLVHTDSDNDGLWTAMYGAGECFAYAATGDPRARDRARRAFEALRFLQKAPEGSSHPPPRGYVARTILPADGPDPNPGLLERDLEFRRTRDRLWKIYEPRWPLTADARWYWKSDTSSDELDGHYFFYPLYYDLVAETEEERERVREVVRDLTDHLIAHGFNLVDHDGLPTRWGRYSPEELNHSKWWWTERGLKSLSLLSYLAVAEHVTGDPKYGEVSRELRATHAYDTNAMVAKIQLGPGSGNQSDDEMAVMCFYNLLKYTRDSELREEIRYAFFRYWLLLQPEMNPFFNFAYAVFGVGASYTNPWGTYPIDPSAGWLEDSLKTLTGFPLDRVNWPHENSHRLDIIPLARQQAREPYQPDDGPAVPRRGYREGGKVLPVENRHFNHWNTDPWQLDYRGDGMTLASGTVFLLPYYMGLYHGFIEAE